MVLNRNTLAEKAGLPIPTVCNVYQRGSCKPATVGKITQDTNLSLTIYLEPYFEEIQDKSFTQIAEDIWQNYLKNKNSHEIDISQFTDWRKAKDSPRGIKENSGQLGL